MKELYDMIFKRKSVRKFDRALKFSEAELQEIRQKIETLTPLDSGIRVRLEVVERSATSSKRGEYCLLLYSEKKPNYLLNAGYLLEQMDLFFAQCNIGVCWYGLAKAKETQVQGLSHVIMLAFGKSRAEDFRTDVAQFKRKSCDEIWKGRFDMEVINAVRLAPSACNSQPWRIESGENIIKVYRKTKIKSIISMPYYNAIDMGICLCFIETALEQKGYTFTRELAAESDEKVERLEIATYEVKKGGYLIRAQKPPASV